MLNSGISAQTFIKDIQELEQIFNYKITTRYQMNTEFCTPNFKDLNLLFLGD